MQTRRLQGTSVTTTALGLGCATLFHLPRPADRRAILRVALDSGIRHFDVAPMYGLGLAESELGQVIRRHREEVTITTKFGIDTTALGRLAGRLQRPVRAALDRLPQVSGGVKSSGRGPGSGLVGRLLYSSEPYEPAAVRRSLDRSLLALSTDHIDLFMVHDPTSELLKDSSELAGYLATEVERGRIGTWGAATDVNTPNGQVRELNRISPVLQIRDDIFEGPPSSRTRADQGLVTFGIMERVLPVLAANVAQSAVERSLWSERFGFDVGAPGALPALLIRQALSRNRSGPVLYGSTRPDRVAEAAKQAASEQTPESMAREGDLLHELATALHNREQGPEGP